MLTVSDDFREQRLFEALTDDYGVHHAYGMVMGKMSPAEADAFKFFVETHDLTEHPPAHNLNLYYGLPIDEESDAI